MIYIELDLHGFTLEDAIIEVIFFIRECIAKDLKEFSLIHGYNSGTVLKSYFNSPEFICAMCEEENFNISKVNNPNPGKTTFRFF